MYENRFNDYRLPSGMLIVFLEKALTLIHMETHLDDVSAVLLTSINSFFRIYLSLRFNQLLLGTLSASILGFFVTLVEKFVQLFMLLLCACNDHLVVYLVQNEDIKVCKQPYSLLTPHTCDASVEQ